MCMYKLYVHLNFISIVLEWVSLEKDEYMLQKRPSLQSVDRPQKPPNMTLSNLRLGLKRLSNIATWKKQGIEKADSKSYS